ncbi:uncharacterized protein HMPREF1541_09903 [Cyphellophora europaea CBS 101466]|uniref:Uncharacterized protein n=1 Tax=Cyphellophora europaea (strain CBS 101466) TaxID=1220924 RepID=W2S8M3_CYPE1|nr:uncharacterized protein HMPREF1541_09903 [Cyphellophora europaea CBS 101466]ETN45027.1 hypothetical protein HMPREF1541_09903 [Cyphellophora europaea CBS 101466]
MTLYIDAEQSLEQSSDLDRIWLIFSKDDLPIVVRFLASWTTLPPWLGSAPKHAIQAVRVHLHANSLIYGYPRRLQWSIDHWRDYIFPLLHGSIVSTKLDYFSPFERPYQFTRQIRNTMRADFAVESNGPANIDWRERIYSIENRIKCCQKKSVRAMRVARAAGDSMSLAPLAHIIFSFLHDLHAFTLHEKSWPTDRHHENFEILVQRTLQYIKLLYELSDAHQTSPRRRREARRFCNHAANDIRFCLGVLCAQQRFPFTFSNLGNFNRQQIADVGGQILWRDYYHRLETIFGILLDDIDEVLDDISTPSLYLTVNLMHRALCYAQASSTKRAERYLSAAIRLCAPAEADAVEWTALEMAKIYAVWWELAPAMRAKLKLPTEPSDWPEDSEWSWTWNKDSRQVLLEYAKVVWADLVRQRYGSEEVVVLREWREL